MKKFILPFLFTIAILSCSKDKSSNTDILEFSVNNISNRGLISKGTSIDSEKKNVYIFIDNNLNNFDFPITINSEIKLISGAQLNSLQTNEITFNSPDDVYSLEINAEDGTIQNWYIFLIHHQIQNSNFEKWYSNKGMNGVLYNEIGASAEKSIWSTANMGTSMYNLYGTQAVKEGENTMAEIKTGKTSQIAITAATLFTGTFDLSGAISNPTDPKQATKFGFPFVFRPKAVNVKYKYKAGEDYIQATLNNPSSIFGGFKIESIEGEDQCTIYAILETRIGNEIQELGRAQFVSGPTSDILDQAAFDFIYTSEATPTHISFVFTSSKDGDLWRGAIGSTLTIDDLELIYE